MAVAGTVDDADDVEAARVDLARLCAEPKLGGEGARDGQQLGEQLAPNPLLGVDHRILREGQQRRDVCAVLEGAHVDPFEAILVG